MSPARKPDYLKSLLEELRKLPKETEWVEFKENNADPDAIGEYISALSNSAAFHGKTNAYLVWGIEDKTHDVVGTSFSIARSKVGAEELENWLLRLLSPKIEFDFYEVQHDDKNVVILEIQAAARQPVQFKKQEFIRVGSYKKPLKEFAERERGLWRVFDAKPFERCIAIGDIPNSEVLRLIDYSSYFDLLDAALPEDEDYILSVLEKETFIERNDAGRWDITNLGATLFAKNLDDFPSLRRKSIRVILYKGDGRVETVNEQEGKKGYAAGFEGLIKYINRLLPSNEVIGQALRKSVPMFPELAIRELVANALIHQDFRETGNGPMIEIFDSRMEITNPGLPLVETERFLDSPPKSRNEALASLLRRFGICEERGSGIDKVVFQTEFYQLPAPNFETTKNSTRAILFAHKNLNDMDKTEKVRACYLHACLRFVERKEMTNSSLRERFKIEEQNRAIASRIITDALEAEMIVPFDPDQGRRHAKYIPYWASSLSL